MKSLLPIIAFALVPLSATSQEPGKQPTQAREPQTKLEQFQAKTGTVIIMAFSKVGGLPAQYGASIAVETREFTDASTGSKQFGITIEVKETGRIERQNTSFIDLDEIESLLKGIDYIAGVDKRVTKLSDFQADYRTKGDFGVSTYSTSKGDIGVAVKSGRYGGVTAYIESKTCLDSAS